MHMENVEQKCMTSDWCTSVVQYVNKGLLVMEHVLEWQASQLIELKTVIGDHYPYPKLVRL